MDNYDFLTRCFFIGDYKISEMCLQSYPCKHGITKLSTNERKLLNGIEIYKILETDGLSHPHFDYCKELIK